MCLSSHTGDMPHLVALVRSGPGPAMSHDAGSGKVGRGIRMRVAATDSLQHSPDAMQVPGTGPCRSTLSARRRHCRSVLAVK